MWPNFFTGFPFPFPTLGRVNYNTLPTVAVTVGTENVTFELPDHAFRNRDYVGGFYINLRQAIPAGTTATLPILIGTNGDTRPLLAYNNEPVTVENIAGTGIYEIHYNKYTNEVYLVNGGYRPTMPWIAIIPTRLWKIYILLVAEEKTCPSLLIISLLVNLIPA